MELTWRDVVCDMAWQALMGGEGKAYFCKLSTRSPKDSVATDTSEDTTLEQRLVEKVRSTCRHTTHTRTHARTPEPHTHTHA